MVAAEARPSPEYVLPTFTPKAQLQLNINSLYIVLSTQFQSNVWHWQLYLHIQETYGWVFHITHEGLPRWEYYYYEFCGMIYSQRIMSAVKIADVTPELHGALRQRIGSDKPVVRLQDSDFGPLDCQTWLLQVLYELDNEGHISVSPGYSIRDIEQEALALALNNRYLTREKKAKLSELRKEMDSAFCVF